MAIISYNILNYRAGSTPQNNPISIVVVVVSIPRKETVVRKNVRAPQILARPTPPITCPHSLPWNQPYRHPSSELPSNHLITAGTTNILILKSTIFQNGCQTLDSPCCAPIRLIGLPQTLSLHYSELSELAACSDCSPVSAIFGIPSWYDNPLPRAHRHSSSLPTHHKIQNQLDKKY